MTFRLWNTRRNWWPAHRSPALKRYAFIGDSNMYGAGVMPEETLPAQAEPLLNEALPAWPVETVNYGVSGYNLINSWAGFRPLLPLFDGLIIALCSNDAEIFGRTFNLAMTNEERIASWEPEHPCGLAVASCLADIGRQSRVRALPVMVIFCCPRAWPPQIRVNEILSGHCAANGLGYFITCDIFAERSLPLDQLVVSAADAHPSALAHELTARHMVREMTRLGWFGNDAASGLNQAPARIAAAAQDMMTRDDFPPDMALGWALRSLEVKTRIAKRRAALEGEDQFEPVAAPVRAQLQAAAKHWHIARRAEACVLEQAETPHKFATNFRILQTARLQLEELAYVLADPASAPALARLPAPAGATAASLAAEPPEFLAQTRVLLTAEMDALNALCAGETDAPIAILRRYVAQMLAETDALDGIVTETAALLRFRNGSLPPEQADIVTRWLRQGIGSIGWGLAESAKITRWAERLAPPPAGPSTEVTVVLRTNLQTDVRSSINLRAEYFVPCRLPFVAACMFDTDVQPLTLRFRVPLFYAGRVSLVWLKTPVLRTPDEIEILECRVSNDPGVNRIVPPAELHCGKKGIISTPLLFLT